MKRARHRRGSGFSLIEVALALGLSLFAIVSLVALLPAGLRSSRNSVEESAALNVLSAVVADRKATAFANPSTIYKIPALTTNMTEIVREFGVAADSQEPVDLALAQARYRVSCTLVPPPTGTASPFIAHFRVGWSAQNTNSSDSVEEVVTFPQP